MKTTWKGGNTACRIIIAMFFGLVTWKNGVSQYYAALQTSATSGNHDLIVGTSANQVVDVYGMVATFSGDFTNVGTETIGVDWTGSWLLAGGGSGAHIWNIFGSEDGATLTFWRTDEDPTTGYGKVLELVGSSVVGELILEDMGKSQNHVQLQSVKFLTHKPALTVFPQPCSSDLHCAIADGELLTSWELISVEGEKVGEVQGSDHLDCSALPEGLYWISAKVNGQAMTKTVSIMQN